MVRAYTYYSDLKIKLS